MNICLCGVESSYPHKSDCPFPMYRDNDRSVARWEAARQAKWALAHPQHDEHDTYIVDEPGYNWRE